MTATLVDANVIIDVVGADPRFGPWSEKALAAASDAGELVINVMVFAEVSLAFSSFERLEQTLPRDRFRREDIPWEAAFLAGKAFVDYRRRGGTRRSPLPDFFIGAHAAVRGYPLLTRDAQRYRTYFPRVQLIGPDIADG